MRSRDGGREERRALTCEVGAGIYISPRTQHADRAKQNPTEILGTRARHSAAPRSDQKEPREARRDARRIEGSAEGQKRQKAAGPKAKSKAEEDIEMCQRTRRLETRKAEAKRERKMRKRRKPER